MEPIADRPLLRVLHLASGDGWAGAERALSLFVEGALASRGLDLEVLLSNEGRLAETLRALGASVTVLPESGVSHLQHARAVRKWMSGRRFDAVHAHRYKEIALALLAPRACFDRLVVTIHGLEPVEQMPLRSALRVWLILWWARLRGACFAAVSGELRDRLVRVFGRRRVWRVPNPVPPPIHARVADIRERLGWAEDRPLVGFVGRLEEVKGPDRFLEIAAAGDTGAGFVLLGDGSMEHELQARVARDGLEDRVAFFGAVPDAMAFFDQLDALALPSRHEGMPMVLLEAAACGVPVVAFEVGGVAEVLDGGPAARLIPDGAVGEFRAALDEILSDRVRIADAQAQWTRSVQQRYGLDATTEAYRQLYGGLPADTGTR